MDTLPPHADHGKITFIYIHIDPVTNHVRYVGKADNPQERFAEHLRCTKKTHHANWIRHLKAQGLLPIQQVIEEVSFARWQERERYWIAFYKEQGEPLTNATIGGDGVNGYVPSSEVRSRTARAIRRSMSHKHKPSQIHQPAKQQAKPTSTRKRGATFTRRRRRMMQKKFLQSFALTNNIVASCANVNIDRKAFYYWLESDEQFRAEYQTQLDKRLSVSRRKGQRIHQIQRLETQDAFLQSFSLTSNIHESAKTVAIDRALVYYWLKNDEQFRIRYRQIEENCEPILDSSTRRKKA